MGQQDFQPLRERAFQFALDVLLFCRTLPATWEARHIADQLFRSGTAVGANYSAAGQGRSLNEFISKLGIVVEEADESCFWLRLIEAAGINRTLERTRLAGESKELLCIQRFAGNRKAQSRQTEADTAVEPLAPLTR